MVVNHNWTVLALKAVPTPWSSLPLSPSPGVGTALPQGQKAGRACGGSWVTATGVSLDGQEAELSQGNGLLLVLRLRVLHGLQPPRGRGSPAPLHQEGPPLGQRQMGGGLALCPVCPTGCGGPPGPAPLSSAGSAGTPGALGEPLPVLRCLPGPAPQFTSQTLAVLHVFILALVACLGVRDGLGGLWLLPGCPRAGLRTPGSACGHPGVVPERAGFRCP